MAWVDLPPDLPKPGRPCVEVGGQRPEVREGLGTAPLWLTIARPSRVDANPRSGNELVF
jgi:hypothetical protein